MTDWMMVQAVEVCDVWEHEEVPSDEYWITKAGHEVPWSSLTDEHLANVVAMLRRSKSENLEFAEREQTQRAGLYPRPCSTDAAHLRQVEEYALAVAREKKTGRVNDVAWPDDVLRYRLDLWQRAYTHGTLQRE